MCGIVGVIARRGLRPSVDADQLVVMRDLLAHRGPDGAGLWEHENVLLGHRRLAIRDLGVGGQQPLATPDGRHVLVYNGELYGEQDLRQQLTGMGVTLRSSCDSEVVLWALATMGEAALPLLRGMYALAWYD
ncbi:MAG TPA: asparagine synthetase B, partial [Planctomycetota bacterium]|nr:asparagine synthetase B [Planctomycetota bacterium]